MSKGLEALKEIKSRYNDRVCIDILEDFDLVEKELKEYEEMKAIKGTTTFDKAIEDTLINACPNVAKKLKALEIIKNKRVNTKALIEILEDEWTWEQYMDEEDDINTGGHQFSRDRLTREEYELLKEVLL